MNRRKAAERSSCLRVSEIDLEKSVEKSAGCKEVLLDTLVFIVYDSTSSVKRR